MNNLKSGKATIINSGTIAADGCGWLLQMKSEDYSIRSIPEEFKKDGLQVNVEILLLEEFFQCGMDPNHKLQVVEIQEIEITE